MMERPRTGGGGREAKVSLARALSKLGYCSRAQARGVVEAGRVAVGGTVRRDPEWRVDPRRDRITVDGAPVAAARRVYLALNKPRGLVTTTADEKGRDTVFRCFEGADLPPHLSPVGRLDRASEGLLLFTNDTRWAARILDPATHLDKTYHVQVGQVADEDLAQRLIAGVAVEGGEVLAAKRASVLRTAESTSWLEIVLDEGKNRQIRRMLEGLDVEVLRLVRVAIGPLRLGELPKGAHRPLADDEKRALDAAVEAAAPRPKRS
jgi:23S rRNA pseudouridine2605 synthase